MPQNVQVRDTSLHMSVSDRRSALVQVGVVVAGFAGLPSLASADGAVSASTISRARGVYGNRIADLKKAVNAGDFNAVASEKSAFVLFNSGAYPFAKSKPLKKAAIEQTNAIFRAVKSGDKAGLKTAYDTYIAANDINGYPDVALDGKTKGQGFSGDFDFKRATKAGVVYQR